MRGLVVWQSNKRMELTIQPDTARACARPAPVYRFSVNVTPLDLYNAA